MATPILNVRVYYVLFVCLLLLHLLDAGIAHLTEGGANPWGRTAFWMVGGGLLTAWVVAPLLERLVCGFQRGSRTQVGGVGEAGFLLGRGVVVFGLYSRAEKPGVGHRLQGGRERPEGPRLACWLRWAA